LILFASMLLQGNFGSLWDLVLASGPVAQSVLLVLLFFSVFSWAIIFKKTRAYRQVDRESHEFYDHFRRASSLAQIYKECDRYPMSPLAGIYKTGYEELSHQVKALQDGGEARRASQEQVMLRSMNGLQRSLQKAATSEMTALETSLSWLATTGAVTPFIGLFGTVIGIINAFQGLGTGAATTIQAVAPGISEALVATAAGLFAAIPAVIAYNHFINRLKVFGAEMDDFSAEFLNLVERSFT
jgi:biopolymer transport protein TolQ